MSRFANAGPEVMPGAWMERRSFLTLSVAALTGLLTGCTRRVVREIAQCPGGSDLDLDTLLAGLQPLAQALVTAVTPNEEGYLAEVARRMSRLGDLPEGKSLRSPVSSQTLATHWPLEAVEYRVAPGASIPYHDHRHYAAVLVGLEGDLQSESFEVLGDEDPASLERFLIRRTRSEVLTAGRISTLSRHRDNIHDLRAPGGARFLDVYTMFRGDADSHSLCVDRASPRAGEGIFEAAWA